MVAGLAHELNNPAAAARRAAAHLHETAENVQSFLARLAKCLEPEHWQHLISAAQEAADQKPPQLDHLSRSDGAETIGKWLEAHGIVSAWDLAPTFVNLGLDAAWLEKLTAKIPADCQADAIRWVEARLNLKSLVNEIE